MSICNNSNSAILSINKPANVKWSMGKGVPGSLDGLYLSPGGASNWRHQPNNVPLLKGKFFVPQGTPLPLKCEEMYQTLPKDSMFFFARNECRPECCNGTFSAMGSCCPCTTPWQRKYVGQMRGGNKSYGNYSF